MSTRLVFETAALADSLRKAFACSPKKGAAFDKAAGIVFEFEPNDPESLIIRSTNLEVFYMEWVDLLDSSGPEKQIRWRFNAQLVASVVASLPIGSGKTITFEDKDDEGKIVHLTSDRTKCRFNLSNTDHYPQWAAFDPDLLTSAPDFGGRMEQIEWAVDKSDPVLSGVHFDGTQAFATNKYRLAVVPFTLELENPVTLPAGIVSTVLKKTSEVKVGASSNQFYIMPDEYTQIRTVIFAGKYPNCSRIMEQEKPATVTFQKTQLIEMIARAMNFAGSERFATLRMFIGAEEIAVMMSNEEMGMLGDVLDVPGQANHTRIEIKVSPSTLNEALTFAPNEEVTLSYNPESSKEILVIDGGSGYRAWVMPRSDRPNVEQ